MHLITGYTGTAHITAANDGAINAHVFGKASYVFNSRDKFEATIENNNTINIGSGEGLFNGRYFEIASGSSDVANIDNGTSGTKRIDLIVARYERDNDTNIESMNVVVIKGTPGTNPVTPAHNTGNILDGVGIADYPLYKVEINGLSITSVTKLFTVREDIVTDVKADNAETLAEITADNAHTLAEIKADNAAHFDGIIDGTVPANTATKLGTATVGGSDTPIYLDEGIPKPCADVLKCKELYTNNNVAPTFSQAGGTITLSDSIVNYKYIEIVFYNCLNPDNPSNSEIYTSTGKIPVKNSAIETDLAFATLGTVQVTALPDEFRAYIAKRHAKITTNKLAHSAPKRAYADIGQYGSYIYDDTNMSRYASIVYKVIAYK